MKHMFTLCVGWICSFCFVHAQSTDSLVSLGTGYENQVWYSLREGVQATAPANEWDLAFEISGLSAAILLNTAIGDQLWVYPKGDTAAWAAPLDTAGIANWQAAYNADTSWSTGALNAGADPADDFDLGWGYYNFITHHVTGDSIYVVRLASGEYKKLLIESLISGTYTFRVADLDGGNEVVRTLSKADFEGKNFGYYAIRQDSLLDREPLSENWDLLFTTYTTLIPSPLPTPYSVSGVLTNKEIEVAKAHPVADPATYEDYGAHDFRPEINTIGYDWKSFDFPTNAFILDDSLVYFIKARDAAIHKLVFTGFGGSANGEFQFSLSRVAGATSIGDRLDAQTTFSLYPNPLSGNTLGLILELPAGVGRGQLELIDITGRSVFRQEMSFAGGFHHQQVALPELPAGSYLVRLQHEQGQSIQKLLIP